MFLAWITREHILTNALQEARLGAPSGEMPYESLPPLILITLFITTAGVLQGGIYRTAYGKPKAVGSDSWDRAMARRDDKIAMVSASAWVEAPETSIVACFPNGA